MENTTITNTSILASSTLTNFTFVLPNPNKWWNYVDFIARCYDCIIHLIYFVYVALKSDSELRTRSCLFLNNINLATFSISILYVFYIPTRAPSFANPTLNAVLCTLTELAWSCLKYARVLSLLVLAAYRYIGCFNVPLYKRINSRLIYIFGIIATSWIVSLLVPLITKFALRTSYSTYYCTDGYVADQISLSIIYYAVNTVLSSVIPSIGIIVLYFKIYEKLKEQVNKTNCGHLNHNNNSQQHLSSWQPNKLAKFARQFLVINCLTSVATVFSTFVEFVNVIAVGLFSLIKIKKESLYEK